MVMLNKLAKAMNANDARTYKVSSKRSPKLEKTIGHSNETFPCLVS